MKKKKETTYLFIDGTNLYAGQYELFGPDKYLFLPYLLSAMEEQIHTIFDRIYFYASYSPKIHEPTKKQKLYLINEGLFYKSALSIPKLVFYKGHRSPTSGQEKGVDIHLGVDIVQYAFLNKYHQGYIFTGDADLIYAIETVKRIKKIPVHAIFLPNRFSTEIAIKSNIPYLLDFKTMGVASFLKRVRKLHIIPIKKGPACMHAG